jgi:hypothetical protein
VLGESRSLCAVNEHDTISTIPVITLKQLRFLRDKLPRDPRSYVKSISLEQIAWLREALVELETRRKGERAGVRVTAQCARRRR